MPLNGIRERRLEVVRRRRQSSTSAKRRTAVTHPSDPTVSGPFEQFAKIQDTQTSKRRAASFGRLAERERLVARLESAGWADGAGNGVEAIGRGSGRARGASQPHREDAEKR